MGDGMPTHLDPPVIGVGRGVLASRPTERVGEPGAALGVLHGALGLQREQSVATLIFDQTGGFALAVQRIPGDQRTGQIDQAKQRACGGDLAFLVTRRDLTDRQPRRPSPRARPTFPPLSRTSGALFYRRWR